MSRYGFKHKVVIPVTAHKSSSPHNDNQLIAIALDLTGTSLLAEGTRTSNGGDYDENSARRDGQRRKGVNRQFVENKL